MGVSLEVGQAVWINRPESTWHGRSGVVTAVRDKPRGSYRIQVRPAGESFSYWFKDKEVSTEPIRREAW